jgi:hypothetical protein
LEGFSENSGVSDIVYWIQQLPVAGSNISCQLLTFVQSENSKDVATLQELVKSEKAVVVNLTRILKRSMKKTVNCPKSSVLFQTNLWRRIPWYFK